MKGIDKNINFDSLLVDRWRFELPVDYDDAKFKKIKVFDYQNEQTYVFSFCERHINKLTLDVFFKMLKQRNV